MTFTIKLNKKATLRNLLCLDITMKDYYIKKEMNADKYTVKYTMKNTTPVQLFNNIYNEKYVAATMLC